MNAVFARFKGIIETDGGEVQDKPLNGIVPGTIVQVRYRGLKTFPWETIVAEGEVPELFREGELDFCVIKEVDLNDYL